MSDYIYRNLIVDCTKDNFLNEKVTQDEHGVTKFRIAPTNKQHLINLDNCTDAVYYGVKSDGHKIGNACEIVGNKVLLPLTLQMTTCEGRLKGILELQFKTGNIRFYGVNFDVFPAPNSESVESTDEFTLLEQKISEVQELIDKGIEASHGKSAYEIAVDNGFEGTETEWLKSLKGADGTNGINGKDGKDGVNGTDGANGIGITKSEINTNGELVINYSDGTSTNLGKVVGADGAQGEQGLKGEKGDNYTLTDSDKKEIANIIKTEYDNEILLILGGENNVTS